MALMITHSALAGQRLWSLLLVTARATPLATNSVKAMVATSSMVRLIKRAAFLW
jgi:hypothetical protein